MLKLMPRLALATGVAIGGLALASAANPDEAKAAKVCAEVYRTVNGGPPIYILRPTCIGSAAEPPVLTISDEMGPVLGHRVGYKVTVDTQ